MKTLKAWWRRFRGYEALVALETECSQVKRSLRAADERVEFARLEIADLQRRLEAERADHAKTKGHVQKLWTFIALRHRIELPAPEGSIRKILQEADRR